MHFKGSVQAETGQAVENLWMSGEFPVDASPCKLFFVGAPLGNAQRRCCVCAFVTRFA